MEELSEIIFTSITVDRISDVFTIVIAALFVIFFLSALLRPESRWGKLSRSAPTILMSVGIFGTFLGIYIGLRTFDVANISKSVPQLLEGLKLAFWTSIVGMFLAVLWRFVQPAQTAEEESVSPEKIHEILASIRNENRDHAQNQITAFTDLKQSISGEGDTSVVTQIQKLRTDFHDFAQKMAEANSDALIKALEDVIKDFNQKLTDQFGENFKQLNQAVGALLTWQENYKDHVERLEGQFSVIAEAMGKSEESLGRVATHTEAIPKNMQSLVELMEKLQVQVDDLGAHLEAVAGLKDKALEAFPIIEANLQNLTAGMVQSVEKMTEEIQGTLEGHRQAHESLTKGFNALRENAEEVGNDFRDRMEGLIAETRKNIDDVIKKQGESLLKTGEEFKNMMNDSVAQFQENIRESMETHFKTFDENMQTELGSALKRLGEGLASLSEKFVSDYGIVAERIKEIIDATPDIRR